MRNVALRRSPSGPKLELLIPETSDDIENVSLVPGAKVTDALNALFGASGGFALPHTFVVNPDVGETSTTFPTLQQALTAVPDGEYWLIIVPPGVTLAENVTVGPSKIVEIQCLGNDQLGILTGDIIWNPDGGALGLTGILLTGNLTGTSGDGGGNLILDGTSVIGNVALTRGGANEIRAYLRGSDNFDHLSGQDIAEISGTFECGGRVFGTFMQFRGSITGEFLSLENCWLGGLAPTVITASDITIRLVNCTLHLVSGIVFSGSAGALTMDGVSAGFYVSGGTTLTNGVLGLLDTVALTGTVANDFGNVPIGVTNFDVTIPAGLVLVLAGAFVQFSPTADMPNGCSIAGARLTDATTVRVSVSNIAGSVGVSGNWAVSVTNAKEVP